MTAYTYTGTGSQFFQGVPARDLTAAEFDELAPELQAAVAGSDLYQAQATKTTTNPKQEA